MLNKIPKDKIIRDTDSQGNPRTYIWVELLERREPGKYGETHSLQFYNRDTRETIYLADLKPQEFGTAAPASPASVDEAAQDKDDLPF